MLQGKRKCASSYLDDLDGRGSIVAGMNDEMRVLILRQEGEYRIACTL